MQASLALAREALARETTLPWCSSRLALLEPAARETTHPPPLRAKPAAYVAAREQLLCPAHAPTQWRVVPPSTHALYHVIPRPHRCVAVLPLISSSCPSTCAMGGAQVSMRSMHGSSARDEAGHRAAIKVLLAARGMLAPGKVSNYCEDISSTTCRCQHFAALRKKGKVLFWPTGSRGGMGTDMAPCQQWSSLHCC